MPLPRWLGLTLKLEWLAVAAVLAACFALTGGSWLLFAVLVLVPDISMLGYIGGPKVGALAYNLAHSLIGPALLAGVAWLAASSEALHVALVWAFHIAGDRALGYGLKLPNAFQDTHLGRIGRQ